MDGGEDVLFHGTFGNEDGVFVVVTAPGHEGHHQVLAQSQLAFVDAGTVSEDLALLEHLTGVAGGLLTKAGVLVGLVELQQVIGAHAALFLVQVAFVGDHDAVGVGVFHLAVGLGHDAGAGVAGHVDFHAGAHQGLFAAQQRHGLALHVGTHEGAVGVVVFQEGDERGRDGDHLAGRDVHEGHLVTGAHFHFALDAHGHELVQEVAVGVHAGVGLGHHLVAFAGSVQMHDLVSHAAIAHHAVRGLDETEVVDLGEGGQRHDQTDVGTFGRFDGADAAIVGGVHVAHFEAGALTGQTAGAQGRQTALVGHFGQGVGLVHELRQLGSTEELLEHRGHRLGIDQVVGHERGDFLDAHALLDGALHAHQTDAVLVLHQFAHQAHAAIAQMVDIVGRTVAVLQLHQHLDGGEDVVVGQGTGIFGVGQAQALVELVTAHRRQVIVIRAAEQVVEEAGGDLGGRRAGRTQTTVDLFLSLFLIGDAVLHQGVADGGRGVGALGVQHGDTLDAGFAHALQQAGSDLVGGFGQHFATAGSDDVFGQEHAVQGVGTHFDGLDARFTDLTPATLGDGLAGLDEHGAVLGGDVGVGVVLAVQGLFHFPHQGVVRLQQVVLAGVEVLQDVHLAHAHGLEQDGGGHLAATVDADIQDVLVVEVEVQPGATHGDDSAGVEHLAAGVGLAAVVFKDDAGRTLQLVDDDALGAVDDERALFRHQGQGAKVDALFLDVADGAVARGFIGVIDHQAHLDVHRGFVGQALGDALGLVVLGLADFVADEFQAGGLVEIFDGEDGVEHAFQTFLLISIGFGNAFLQELAVGVDLKIEEVRNGESNVDFAELFGKLAHAIPQGR